MSHPPHHKPVFLNYICNNLLLEKDSKVLDATLGEGGHTIAFLKANKRVVSIERDPDILKEAKEKIQYAFVDTPSIPWKNNLTLHNVNYSDLEKVLDQERDIDFALFDLGISMFHYKASGRGFSFKQEEPLDMRLDQKTNITAHKVINTYSEEKINEILLEYGEEKFAKKIARKISEIREKKEIQRSKELADLIYGAVPPFYRHKKIHPATKSFQGLRIFINQELEHIEAGICTTIDRLSVGGRIGVISYHSLEDRIVKNVLKKFVQPKKNVNKYKEKLPNHNFSVNSKIIYPSQEEIKENSAARSAKLRVLHKKF